jgi:hypothetical protein
MHSLGFGLDSNMADLLTEHIPLLFQQATIQHLPIWAHATFTPCGVIFADRPSINHYPGHYRHIVSSAYQP